MLNLISLKFACDELWTHSFPLHFRLHPHLHVPQTSKPSTGYHPGSLLLQLTTHFSSLAVHNRKNLFVYCGDRNDYYMRFREDIYPPSTPGLLDDSLLLSENNNSTFYESPSPQMNNQNNSMKNRQRHDSVSKFLRRKKILFIFFRELFVFMLRFMD